MRATFRGAKNVLIQGGSTMVMAYILYRSSSFYGSVSLCSTSYVVLVVSQ